QQVENISLNLVSNDMTVYLNVIGSFMEYRVGGNMHC
ncbi:hypothetical protein A2U01_0117976, partial [Trifolium medium]|nr:hypothetical protein [Trifolium medium]